MGWVGTLLLSLLAVGCFVPMSPEGLPCAPGGSCPVGQSCGFDDVCRLRHDQNGCDPDCVDGYTCGTDGQCHPDLDGDDQRRLDDRAGVGNVIATVSAREVKCLGSVVAAKAVLTSARCVEGATSVKFVQASGEVSVDRFVVHPDFNAGDPTSDADLAILHLASPAVGSSLRIATSAPSSGTSSVAIVPASELAADRMRYQVDVVLSNVDTKSFTFSSTSMQQPYACPIDGGPTVKSGSTETIIGIHLNSACGGGSFRDVRVDYYSDWIVDEIAAATPATCDGFVSEKCADCGSTQCDDSGGQAEYSCVGDEGTYPCGGDQTCNADGTCEGGGSGTECVYDGGYLNRPCSECGREWCLPSGNWSGNCAKVDTCTGDEQCVDTGPSEGYPSYWVCEAPVSCNTSSYSGICDDIGDPAPPAQVDAGTLWVTSSGCGFNKCRVCECMPDGTVDCDPCEVP